MKRSETGTYITDSLSLSLSSTLWDDTKKQILTLVKEAPDLAVGLLPQTSEERKYIIINLKYMMSLHF